jgi:UDP-N-acetylmuramate--alanine ligase
MNPEQMKKARQIHFIGIGGCGMSAIAKILAQQGFQVSGSDLKESSNTIRLKDLGVKIFFGHDAIHLREADLVVYSSAVRTDNPEYKEALSLGLPLWQRAEMLSWLMDQFQHRIAVAGTHGKTTTTSMLSHVFKQMELDPTFLIGGETDSVDGNARLGNGPYLIAEADESDGSFLNFNPTVEIITNIEADHLDHFGTLNKVEEGFEAFVEKLDPKGLLIMDGTQQGNQSLIEKVKKKFEVITYGLSGNVDYKADKMTYNSNESSYEVHHKGKTLGMAHLQIPGWQNVLNSLSIFAVGEHFELSFQRMASALQSFTGARRRFQVLGETDGIMVVDDYAHHPTEIRATLEAAKLGYPDRRLIAVFQPHRFTRTYFLFKEFSYAFEKASQVMITDVYSAGELPIPGVTGELIAVEIQKASKTNTEYLPRKEQIVTRLLETAKAGDIILLMGAGDINTIGKEFLTRLKIKDENKG